MDHNLQNKIRIYVYINVNKWITKLNIEKENIFLTVEYQPLISEGIVKLKKSPFGSHYCHNRWVLANLRKWKFDEKKDTYIISEAPPDRMYNNFKKEKQYYYNEKTWKLPP